MKVLFLTDDEFTNLFWLFKNSKYGHGTNTFGVSVDDWHNLRVQFDFCAEGAFSEADARHNAETRHAHAVAVAALGLKDKPKRRRSA